jgi:hypothetical protein
LEVDVEEESTKSALVIGIMESISSSRRLPTKEGERTWSFTRSPRSWCENPTTESSCPESEKREQQSNDENGVMLLFTVVLEEQLWVLCSEAALNMGKKFWAEDIWHIMEFSV